MASIQMPFLTWDLVEAILAFSGQNKGKKMERRFCQNVCRDLTYGV